MSDLKKNYNQLLETLIGVFTVDKGKIKILLMHKENEPYKGYWILPGNIVSNEETLENNVTDVVYDTLGLQNLYVEQCYTFSNLDRDPEDRIVATTFMGLIDSVTLSIRQEQRVAQLEWFDIDSIPKTGYDHDKIIIKLISHFKSKIINSNILKMLFPSDFTLPELQKVYEQILNIKLDRRNFRKKLINLDYIIDTGEINEGYTGRPAKLYRFKEDLKERNLF
ncbi:MAG: NUDIX hydrolase [Bacilli bacterium]